MVKQPDNPDADTSSSDPEAGFNPFDMARIRANEPLIETASEELVRISVSKPRKNVFFRVHPEPEYAAKITIIEYAEEGVIGSDLYFVAPIPGLAAEAHAAADKAAKSVTLFTCMTRAGTVFLMPCTNPTGGHGDAWHVSALRVAELAKTKWLKRTTQGGAYVPVVAKVDIPEPNWPADSLEDLMRKGFGDDHVITSAQHPVLKTLAGEL
jgi:hypothetical protein